MLHKPIQFKNPEEKIKEIIKNQYYNDISFNDLKFKHFLKI